MSATIDARTRLYHDRRVDWLREHPELLTRLPGAYDDVSPTEANALDAALRGMSLEKLFSPTAAAKNVRWDIRVLVSEIRGERMAGTGS